MIDYLYKDFKNNVIKWMMPFYFLQIGTLYLSVMMNPALDMDGFVNYRSATQTNISVVFNFIMSVTTLIM